ncbi:N-acetylmuramoyl-L-alanine amidase [Geoalkalibacter halelectricus]|uniref:N-acetylmuramoyl-L-alanine amidase n=1 Tax=Geoalkalibacter halelectricus TaxID=2847045 RepID=A0ABY5ZQI3_9BACT|nr:N-acetylmuramoyl-L-alanine amidase [Geoalkalibacter halelectricus]MDO3376700.1 N-acetylmuramoyl-L-alanine amidase [Geoalkalibacter halelectricus]UWZ81348.1 N-acetylmuramoyl-L-alanine amidase [Geoalkalibacter halelectricus]
MSGLAKFALVVSLLAVLPLAQVAEARSLAKVESLRFWSNPGYTRVVLDLSRAADYRAATLPADPKSNVGPRLFVDIAASERGTGLSTQVNVEDGVVKQVRTGTPQPGTTRVVFDLARTGDYKVFHLSDPFRIVVDIGASPEASSSPAPAPQTRAPAGSAAAKDDDIAAVLGRAPESQPLRVRLPSGDGRPGLRRIVVDPGHGGKDPGAVGPNGVLEKDVNLALAKVLKQHLEKELGVEVILTRDRDIYLPLQERTAIANRAEADLFISLHANASHDRRAYGTETYFLNLARSEQAAAVAARENGMTLKELGDLEAILFDLMANSKINESSRLATEIQKALVTDLSRNYSNIRDLGVRQGPFFVLLGATMPSVLVEVAFISNPREEALLADRQFQERSARAIARAVRNYGVALNLLAQR